MEAKHLYLRKIPSTEREGRRSWRLIGAGRRRPGGARGGSAAAAVLARTLAAWHLIGGICDIGASRLEIRRLRRRRNVETALKINGSNGSMMGLVETE